MSDEITVEPKPKSNLAALDDKDVAIANYIFYLLGPFNGITALLGFILALVKKVTRERPLIITFYIKCAL